jgi:DNA-binding beta-propeller fold protein YncE
MLTPHGTIAIPPGTPTEFDHGDVHLASGRVFVAHTQAGTVEVLDGPHMTHLATIPGCAEASGILVAQSANLVFAAARGTGQVLVIDAATLAVQRAIAVDPGPNGLAWHPTRRLLLVADVQANTARLVTPEGATQAVTPLPGRPRWCVCDAAKDRFYVNIREPACIAMLDAATGQLQAQWPIPSKGPHGLDLAPDGMAYVASDGGQVIAVDTVAGMITAQVSIAGVPDATWYNPTRQQLYVAIGDPGCVQVVDVEHMQVVQTLTTAPGAHTTAFDVQRQTLFVFLPGTSQAGVYRITDQ